MTARQLRLIVRALRGRGLQGLRAAKAGDVSVEKIAHSPIMKFKVARQGKELGSVGVYVHPGERSATLGTVVPTVPTKRVGPFAQMTFDQPQAELNLGVATHLRMLRNIRQALPPSVKQISFVRQPFGERGRYRRSTVRLR